MTILKDDNKTVSIANGVLVTFAFTFKVLAAEDVAVYLNDVLVPPSAYSVAGIGDDTGGSINFTLAPIDGGVIAIIRSMDFTQEADYVPYDSFPAEVHEKQLDRQVMMIQQLKEEVDRSLKGSPSEGQSIVFPGVEARKDKVLSFDSNGAPVVEIDSTSFASDVQFIKDNLAAIIIASQTLSMTLDELSLVVDGNPAVEATSYPTIADAYNYALTVCQSGARLNLTIPANTTINETQQLNIDSDRLRFSLVGAGSTSVLDMGFNFLNLSGDRFALQDFTLNTAAPILPVLITQGNYSRITGVSINASGLNSTALTIGGYLSLSIEDSNLAGDSAAVNCTARCGLSIDGGTLQSTTSGASAINVVTANKFTDIEVLGGTTVSAPNYTGTEAKGFLSDRASQILITSASIDASIDVDYDPPADTNGNFHSRIITTQ